MSAARLTHLVALQVGRPLLMLWGISALAFAALGAAPGDFFSEQALSPTVSRESVETWRERVALDRPWPERYGRWLLSVARGDGGYSLAYQSAVTPLVQSRAGVTLLLTGVSLVVSWSLALVLGVWAAARETRWDGRLIGALNAGVLGVPDLLLALGLLLVAARTGFAPTGGMIADLPDTAAWLTRAASVAHHLTVPVLALTLSFAPMLVRHVSVSVSESLRAPFVLAARARGIPFRRIVWRSALRAAAQPLIVLFGLSFAGIFSASMVVEVILSWPGLGPLFLEAVRARDTHLVLAGVMLAATLLLAGNAMADTLLRAADPRIGEQ